MKKNTAEDRNIAALEEYIAELEETLVYVREREPRVVEVTTNKSGRMQQVLDVLNKYGHVSVPKIASEVGIDPRNVSSQLSYLRAGKLNGVKYAIATDSRGYKFIER